MKKSKVLLIGWDGADWKYISPLIDSGLMPSLKKLIEGGTMGRLATLDPPLSPTLWTSIATGKRPYKHGIHGFTEPDPSGEGIRPIYSTNRKVKAIWNILTQHHLKTHVIGWWPSHPAEPINGTMISNLYQRANKNITEEWPMLKGTVHPEHKTDLFAKLRIHPEELTLNHIAPFVPNYTDVDQSKDYRLNSIAKIISDCSSIHAATTYIMENEEWDFLAVYYDAIDHFCHGFMKFHPPHRAHIPLNDFNIYKDVVTAGCRYHDMMLGRLMELAGEDTTILLISDHGFHPDHNRPKEIPKEPAGPAIEHSPYGIIVANGPGIKKDASIFGASLLDITPTLLHLFQLPIAKDMDGRALVNLFENIPDLRFINSWENIKGVDGSHPKNLSISSEEARTELQQLIELGYIDDPGENGEEAVKNTVDENNYNLARAFFDGGKWEEGAAILEKLCDENPTTVRFALYLCYAYQNLGKYKKLRKMVEHLRGINNRESAQLDLLEASLLLSEERPKKALALFQKVEREAGDQPSLHLRIAFAYMQLNKLVEAEKAIKKELKIQPEDATSYYTLGLIYYKQANYEAALEVFLKTVGLLYYYPVAHFYIGECLSALKKYKKAIEAYDTALHLAPAMNSARLRIISIYEINLKQPGKALAYKVSFKQQLKGTITIVSGLPRSGTSMMMQMLEAGGLEIFTDQERTADESNPKGYYEHNAIKSLKQDHSFLEKATDKVAKVVAQLLPSLPKYYQYNIIFMERDIYEVVASQQKMLHRQGKKIDTATLPINLVQQFEKTIKSTKDWATKQANVEILFVNHRDIIEQPFMQALLIKDFINQDLEVEKMANCVDPNLYREKMLRHTAADLTK